MAIVLVTAMRDALANAFDDQINTGTGTSQIIFETSAPADIVTFDLSATAFGASSAGVITLAGVPITSSTAGSTLVVAQFQMTNHDGTDQLQGTVATSGADINVSSTTINNTKPTSSAVLRP